MIDSRIHVNAMIVAAQTAEALQEQVDTAYEHLDALQRAYDSLIETLDTVDLNLKVAEGNVNRLRATIRKAGLRMPKPFYIGDKS